jgi:uncharacterized protein YciI
VAFDRFELVLLKRPADAPPLPEHELEQLQERHLAHLSRMRDEGHLVVAGPFDEQPDPTLRGLCLYQTGSVVRTAALAAQDPSVVAGRLECEVMAFYCQKGAIADPRRRTPTEGTAHTGARLTRDAERGGTMQLDLTEEEVDALRQLLESSLSDLKGEIHDTDNVRFRSELTRYRDSLQSIVARLGG